MKVNHIMSKNVVTVEMDDSLGKVKDIFLNNMFHHLLVVEDKQLYGIISDRDLLKSLSPRIDTAAETIKDLAYLNKKVHQIMTRSPIVLNENAKVTEAIALFNQHKISCIPIINDDSIPVGMLSWRDIMRVLIKKT
ncbi:CBS domain-containing protein [Shewanella marina]|uniref:CBS domain-containing protein n=1 Tax=Shewanella marina TaxID=487319 RepID=UPI0005636C72|nr:CBS domain-containing protein [Shewanella marina]